MQLSTSIPPGFFEHGLIALDLETSAKVMGTIDYFQDRVVLISLSNGERTIVLQPGAWLSELWAALKAPDTVMVAHSADFDLRFLWSLGFEGYPTKIWDTLHTERVLTAGYSELCDLAATAWRHINTVLDKSVRSSFFGHMGDFTEQQITYSAQDAEVLIPIMHSQYAACLAKGLLPTIELENRLVPVIAKMQYTGVAFDEEAWYNLVVQEKADAAVAEQVLQQALQLPTYTLSLFDDSICGINLNNPVKLKAALGKIGINVPDTQADTLWEHWAKHPEAADLLQTVLAYRSHTKGPSFNYAEYIHPLTHRIHTEYKQTGAKTGRLSSVRPNLQNVPTAERYRACFVARHGWVLVKSDAGQQEFRILAELTGDSNLIEVCLTEDVHVTNAMFMFDIDVPTYEQRRTAKNVGFALSYGAQALKIAMMLRIPLAQAETIVQYGQDRFPGVDIWAKQQLEFAQANKYVQTIGGRRRYFQIDPDQPYKIANQARNAPVQGTAADIMKLALVLVDEELRERSFEAQLVLTIHDELVVEAPEREAQDVAGIVVKQMEAAGAYYVKKVPIPADATISRMWKK